MSMATRENLIKYLGLGYKPGDVAKIFGVTPAVISQFISDQENIDAVRAARAKNQLQAAKIDDSYTAIEEKATATILERLNQGFYKPTELLAVATMANKATRKLGNMEDANQNGETVTVRITLPVGLAGIEIVKTAKNQVLRVGDVSLQPLPKAEIHEMAHGKQAQLPAPDANFEV